MMKNLAACILLLALEAALPMQALAQSRPDSPEPFQFVAWPPETRVEYLRRHRFDRDLQDLLVATGTDAVPAVTSLIRHGSSKEAGEAIEVLCRMDQYVEVSEIPLPGYGPSIYIRPLNIRGYSDTRQTPDGRRIGPEGLAALQAAAQSDKKEVRRAAENCFGTQHALLMSMPLPDLVALWETKTKECNHTQICWRGDKEHQLFLMDKVLAERAPESLYVLAGRIQGTDNGFVIWEAMDVLRLADEYSMRVGQVETGKKLIQAIASKLDFTNTIRLLPVGFLQIGLTHHKELEWRQERQRELEKLRSGAGGIAPSASRMFVTYAKTQGENIPVFVTDREYQAFWSWFSQRYPDFPSWEYVTWNPDEELFHPRFKIKRQRYLEAWKEFKQSKTTPNP